MATWSQYLCLRFLEGSKNSVNQVNWVNGGLEALVLHLMMLCLVLIKTASAFVSLQAKIFDTTEIFSSSSVNTSDSMDINEYTDTLIIQNGLVQQRLSKYAYSLFLNFIISETDLAYDTRDAKISRVF